jgi:hypothetical protein
MPKVDDDFNNLLYVNDSQSNSDLLSPSFIKTSLGETSSKVTC